MRHVKSDRQAVVTWPKGFTDKQKSTNPTAAYLVTLTTTSVCLLISRGGKIVKCINFLTQETQGSGATIKKRYWYGIKSGICCVAVWWCLAGFVYKAPQFLFVCLCMCVYITECERRKGRHRFVSTWLQIPAIIKNGYGAPPAHIKAEKPIAALCSLVEWNIVITEPFWGSSLVV